MDNTMLGKIVRMIVTIPAEWLGTLADLCEKLLGQEEGDMWLAALKKFLRKENPWTLTILRRLTLTIGSVTKGDLLQRLSATGNAVTEWAGDIMSKPAFTTNHQPIQIELGWSSVKNLGFTEPPTTTELFARIREVGSLCPAEVGPHLRLTDADQPNGTAYWIMMETISDSHGYPNVFSVGRLDDGGRWLGAYCARPGRRWALGSVVVFVPRK